MALSFAVRDAGICKVIDWSMKGGSGCRPATDAELEMLARIDELEDAIRAITYESDGGVYSKRQEHVNLASIAPILLDVHRRRKDGTL